MAIEQGAAEVDELEVRFVRRKVAASRRRAAADTITQTFVGRAVRPRPRTSTSQPAKTGAARAGTGSGQLPPRQRRHPSQSLRTRARHGLACANEFWCSIGAAPCAHACVCPSVGSCVGAGAYTGARTWPGRSPPGARAPRPGAARAVEAVRHEDRRRGRRPRRPGGLVLRAGRAERGGQDHRPVDGHRPAPPGLRPGLGARARPLGRPGARQDHARRACSTG
jgi:hypothetical protein